jgi:hypothetical protein
VLALRRSFERVLREGYKLDDKCLRNKICTLINYVVTSLSSHHFFLERNDRRIACMKATLKTSTYDYFKKEFADKGIMDILLDIVQNTKINPLNMREMSFDIISNISNKCRANQKGFRRKGGLEILKDNFAYAEVDQTGNASNFLFSVLDCLNNSVFSNKRSELHFLDIEGVYVLLDLVESCLKSLKRLILSSLCAILENNKSF